MQFLSKKPDFFYYPILQNDTFLTKKMNKMTFSFFSIKTAKQALLLGGYAAVTTLLYSLQHVGLIAIVAPELFAIVLYGVNGIALSLLAASDYGNGVLRNSIFQ